MDAATSTPGLGLPSVKSQFMRKLSERIPQTGEGHPAGFFRSDLIPDIDTIILCDNDADNDKQDEQPKGATQLEGTAASVTESSEGTTRGGEEPQQLCSPIGAASETVYGVKLTNQITSRFYKDAQAAYVELNYDQGFPVLPSGETFWNKLNCEPGYAYGAFKVFLEAQDSGPRTLALVLQHQEIQMFLSSAFPNSSSAEHLYYLREWYYQFYWQVRAKAFDLFKEAEYRHRRVQRAMNVEGEHYVMAQKLLDRVMPYVIEDKRFMEELTPATAISALKTVVEVQRISAGLYARGPLPSAPDPGLESSDFEMIMRSVSKKNNAQLTVDQQGRVVNEQQALLQSALDDPSTANLMQEVIIRMSKTSMTPRNAQSNQPRAHSFGAFEADAPSNVSHAGPPSSRTGRDDAPVARSLEDFEE
jgi:hypothetical protein